MSKEESKKEEQIVLDIMITEKKRIYDDFYGDFYDAFKKLFNGAYEWTVNAVWLSALRTLEKEAVTLAENLANNLSSSTKESSDSESATSSQETEKKSDSDTLSDIASKVNSVSDIVNTSYKMLIKIISLSARLSHYAKANEHIKNKIADLQEAYSSYFFLTVVESYLGPSADTPLKGKTAPKRKESYKTHTALLSSELAHYLSLTYFFVLQGTEGGYSVLTPMIFDQMRAAFPIPERKENITGAGSDCLEELKLACLKTDIRNFPTLTVVRKSVKSAILSWSGTEKERPSGSGEYSFRNALSLAPRIFETTKGFVIDAIKIHDPFFNWETRVIPPLFVMHPATNSSFLLHGKCKKKHIPFVRKENKKQKVQPPSKRPVDAYNYILVGESRITGLEAKALNATFSFFKGKYDDLVRARSSKKNANEDAAAIGSGGGGAAAPGPSGS